KARNRFVDRNTLSEILVLTTADSPELAHRIASGLIAAGEAACVNILPGIRSIYRWQGKVCDESEILLLIKSTTQRFEAVRARIRELHTYEVPEVVAVEVSSGDPDYLRWLRDQVTASKV